MNVFLLSTSRLSPFAYLIVYLPVAVVAPRNLLDLYLRCHQC